MKPLDCLGELLDKHVLIRLKNGMEIRGVLKAFDMHINLVVENAEFRDKVDDKEVERKFKKMFIRGDVIVMVS
jgi:small nuclear ribonucleoprotein